MYHDSPMGGHSGEFKTYKRIATDWYWIGMKRDIHKYVRRCQVCQQNKSQSLSPGGLLQPLPIPDKVGEEISMDFIGGLPLMGLILYWSSLIVLLNTVIFWDFATHILQNKWLIYLHEKLCNYMGFLALLLQTVIVFSLANFGVNFFVYQGLLFAIVPLIIHKRMAKQRLLTAAWRLICAVFLALILRSGLCGCIGMSFGSILPIKVLLE